MNYKRNTVTLLTRKILELSDPDFHQKNFELLTKTLKNNGYPDNFINDNIDNTIKKLISFGPQNLLEQPLSYVSLPYEPVTFGRLKSCLANYGIKTVTKSQKSMKSFYTNLKDPVSKAQTSGVVYAIKCECNQSYIGNTGQFMLQRFNQHLKGDSTHSALSAHLRETLHRISFDDMNICCTEKNRRVREVKEMIYIKTNNNINERTDCYMLGDCYDHLLNKLNINFDNKPADL